MKTIKNIIYGVMAGVTFGLTSCDTFLEEKPLDQNDQNMIDQALAAVANGDVKDIVS